MPLIPATEIFFSRRIPQRWPAIPFFAFVLLSAQIFAADLERLNFERYTPRDGLPAAVVYCGREDSRGFLWFGTADGVARFDGREFRVFRPNPSDPESLANGAVLEIQEDAKGDLWMATEGGLDLWHRDTERFTHFRNDPTNHDSLSDDTTQCLLLEADGTMWVGTARGGLNHFDPKTGKFERFSGDTSGDPGVSDSWIRCLFRDHAGQLWIGTGNGGLDRFDPVTRKFKVYHHRPDDPQSLPHDRVSAISEDRNGNLWIGTDGGLCRLGPNRERFDVYPVDGDFAHGAPSQVVTTVLADNDQSIWVGTDGSGFLRFDPVKRTFSHNLRSKYAGYSLLSNQIRAVLEDSKGDLWIGHFPAGISHFDRAASAFHVYTSVPDDPTSMSDDQVLSFWEDPSGELWVGTDNGGLNHWDPAKQKWDSYSYRANDPTSLGAKAAICIFRDSGGTLWVGTWNGGLNRFDAATGTFHRYLPDENNRSALSDAHVWRIVEDQQKELWIGTIGGGVEHYVPGEDGFIHFRHNSADPHSISDDIVSSLLVTRDNTLWAGTPKGLAKYNRQNKNWDRFQPKPDQRTTLNAYWIFDLVEDKDGTIWATTEGGGLNHVDPRTGICENFRTADGLPSDVLRGILQEDSGVLWIGSNRGLVQFDPRTRQARVFDESNGLPGSQFNPHARLRAKNGDFLFGSTQGFVRFDPRELTSRSSAPRVVLTDFEVFSDSIQPAAPGSPLARSITETKKLKIPRRDSVLGFEFAALSFRSAARTQYQVKLEGFDTTWRNLGTERRTTFTNLDPGSYRLRVIAGNGDGVWNNEGVSLDLTVIPPWWQTWWFRGGSALVVLGGAGAVGWRVAAHREREARRQRELDIERERAREREKAAEDLRALNQELEQRVADRTTQLVTALKELEAFSYSVSHDLRAPLRAMDGFSRVLLEDYCEKLDDEGKDSLNRIRNATQKMGTLIDDLLNLSRVSRDEIHCGAVDLSQLATAIMDDLRHSDPKRKVEFTAEPNLVAKGDQRLLQIALENLLSNAFKFSSKRPVSKIEFGSVMRDGELNYFVRDNGAGFDMSYARKLFGAFQRFHTEHEFPGTGIGLATFQRIIHRHGGKVAAESQPDLGATFYFTLPRQL